MDTNIDFEMGFEMGFEDIENDLAYEYVYVDDNMKTIIDSIMNVFLKEYGTVLTAKSFCQDIVNKHFTMMKQVEPTMCCIYDSPELLCSSNMYAIACDYLGLIEDSNMRYHVSQMDDIIFIDDHNGNANGISNHVSFRKIIKVLESFELPITRSIGVESLSSEPTHITSSVSENPIFNESQSISEKSDDYESKRVKYCN
jgi:hypothetical protein